MTIAQDIMNTVFLKTKTVLNFHLTRFFFRNKKKIQKKSKNSSKPNFVLPNLVQKVKINISNKLLVSQNVA